jgi:hypothetical protein
MICGYLPQKIRQQYDAIDSAQSIQPHWRSELIRLELWRMSPEMCRESSPFGIGRFPM